MSAEGWGTHPRIPFNLWMAGRYRKIAAYFRAGRWPYCYPIEGDIEDRAWADKESERFEGLATKEEAT